MRGGRTRPIARPRAASRPVGSCAGMPDERGENHRAAERARVAAAVRALIAGTRQRAGRETVDLPFVTTADSGA